jgi:TetR/AcrR family fatty acid metabolism transcriptional regulator
MRGRRKNDETRAAILTCAAEVFSQRAFHEVLTDEIALRLGIGKGTIYRYFESKEDLYFAAISSGLEGMHEAITAVFQEDAPLELSVERLVRTMLEYFWNRRDFFLLLNRMEPKLDASERQEWQERRQTLMGVIMRALQRELPRSCAGRSHTVLAVEMLFGMIRSTVLYRSPEDTVTGLSRLVTQIFLNGIYAKPGQRLVKETRRGLRVVAKQR